MSRAKRVSPVQLDPISPRPWLVVGLTDGRRRVLAAYALKEDALDDRLRRGAQDHVVEFRGRESKARDLDAIQAARPLKPPGR